MTEIVHPLRNGTAITYNSTCCGNCKETTSSGIIRSHKLGSNEKYFYVLFNGKSIHQDKVLATK